MAPRNVEVTCPGCGWTDVVEIPPSEVVPVEIVMTRNSNRWRVALRSGVQLRRTMLHTCADGGAHDRSVIAGLPPTLEGTAEPSFDDPA